MNDRAMIVRLLAETSHETWMRQKERDQNVPRDELGTDVTAHDIERAEDALEARGLLSERGRQLHWHKEPAASMSPFVRNVPLMPTPKGLKAVLEVTAYREGTKISVVPSVV